MCTVFSFKIKHKQAKLYRHLLLIFNKNIKNMSFYSGLDKLAQKGKSLSPLASITAVSLFLIISMCLLFLWKKYLPCKGRLNFFFNFSDFIHTKKCLTVFFLSWF